MKNGRPLTDDEIVVQVRLARALARNAGELRRSPFPALAEIDRLIDEKQRRMRAGVWTGPNVI